MLFHYRSKLISNNRNVFIDLWHLTFVINLLSFFICLKVSSFKQMSSEQELQRNSALLRYDQSKSRRIGEAMQQAVKIFSTNKAKAPQAKMVLFLVVRGRTYGCVYKVQSAAKALKALGVRVYIIGFGTRLILEELTMITTPPRIFRATKYEHVVIGSSRKPSIMIRLQHRLQRCKYHWRRTSYYFAVVTCVVLFITFVQYTHFIQYFTSWWINWEVLFNIVKWQSSLLIWSKITFVKRQWIYVCDIICFLAKVWKALDLLYILGCD